jgi:hypothetical protein
VERAFQFLAGRRFQPSLAGRLKGEMLAAGAGGGLKGRSLADNFVGLMIS